MWYLTVDSGSVNVARLYRTEIYYDVPNLFSLFIVMMSDQVMSDDQERSVHGLNTCFLPPLSHCQLLPDNTFTLNEK